MGRCGEMDRGLAMRRGRPKEPPMLQLRKRINRIPAFTFHGCVVTKHRSKSCRGLCRPINGIGACGRIAPHSMLSRIQMSIAAYKREMERKAQEESSS
jgi:hypothetical protein